jgi:hypothetical protein
MVLESILPHRRPGIEKLRTGIGNRDRQWVQGNRVLSVRIQCGEPFRRLREFQLLDADRKGCLEGRVRRQAISPQRQGSLRALRAPCSTSLNRLYWPPSHELHGWLSFRKDQCVAGSAAAKSFPTGNCLWFKAARYRVSASSAGPIRRADAQADPIGEPDGNAAGASCLPSGTAGAFVRGRATKRAARCRQNTECAWPSTSASQRQTCSTHVDWARQDRSADRRGCRRSTSPKSDCRPTEWNACAARCRPGCDTSETPAATEPSAR